MIFKNAIAVSMSLSHWYPGSGVVLDCINSGSLHPYLLREFADNKGADQPAHPSRLISAFVIRFLESTISKLATSEISNF